MRSLLPFIITGIVTGSLYGLAGVGLVLTYRTSGVFNFGHGAIAAAAAYCFYTLHFTHGLPWPVAAGLTVMAFGVVVGLLLEGITRGLGNVPEAVVTMATVGLLLGVQGLLGLVYGTASRSFPNFLPGSGFTITNVNVSWAQITSVVIATASTVGLYLFLRRARLGVAMRAVVDQPRLVALSGDNPLVVRRAAWIIGSAFAAISGILLAPTLDLDAFLLTFLVVQAFGACAVGLFSSLPLTYLGGLAVGVAAAVGTKYLTEAPLNGLPTVMPFLVLLGALLTIPPRRFPRRVMGTGSLVAGAAPPSGRSVRLLGGAGLVGLLFVPSVVGTRLPVWITGLVYIIIFGSLALLVWISGQISLGHAAFVAVGATTMGHLTTDHGLPWALALVLAGLAAVPVGALVAIPAVRLSGLYLALATLGFGLLMQNVVYPTSMMFGAKLSVQASRPRLGPLDGLNDTHFYYLVLAIAVACLGAFTVISRSRLGRLLRALAETPTMLATHGVGVNVTRLLIFCISAFFAGCGGALLVTQFGAASGVSYGPVQSLLLLTVLALCGTRVVRSSVLAAAFLAVVPGYLTSFDQTRQTFAFGLVAVVAGIVIAQRSALREYVQRAASASGGRFSPAAPSRRFRPEKPEFATATGVGS